MLDDQDEVNSFIVDVTFMVGKSEKLSGVGSLTATSGWANSFLSYWEVLIDMSLAQRIGLVSYVTNVDIVIWDIKIEC